MTQQAADFCLTHKWKPLEGAKVLVISRNRGEKIIIGDDIEIMLVDTRGGSARIGIDAPKEVSIHREEVYLAIQAERRKLLTEGEK